MRAVILREEMVSGLKQCLSLTKGERQRLTLSMGLIYKNAFASIRQKRELKVRRGKVAFIKDAVVTSIIPMELVLDDGGKKVKTNIRNNVRNQSVGVLNIASLYRWVTSRPKGYDYFVVEIAGSKSLKVTYCNLCMNANGAFAVYESNGEINIKLEV